MRVFFSAALTCAGHGSPRMRSVGEPSLAEVVIAKVSDYKVPLDTGRRVLSRHFESRLISQLSHPTCDPDSRLEMENLALRITTSFAMPKKLTPQTQCQHPRKSG